MVLGTDVIKYWMFSLFSTKYIEYHPGYLIARIPSKRGLNFQRLFVLPEEVGVEIENQICAKFGEKGKEQLREIGRIIGYNGAYLLDAPKRSKGSVAEIDRYLSFALYYASSGWAKTAKLAKYDDAMKSVTAEYSKHIVCRLNGNGILFTEHLNAGFLEYVFDVPFHIAHSTCQGRHDPLCSIVYAPSHDKKKIPILYSDNMMSMYTKYNSPQPLMFTAASLSSFLKDGVVVIDEGIMKLKNDSFFLSTVLLLTMLEELPKSLPGAEKTLYDIGFRWGNRIAEKENKQFISDLFSVYGYGDARPSDNMDKPSLSIRAFPWTGDPDPTITYPLLRGIASGCMSKIFNKEINLQHAELVCNPSDRHCTLRLF